MGSIFSDPWWNCETKVALTTSTRTSLVLRERFLPLIVLFIMYVVIPEFLCPPVVDGLMSTMGPMIAYYFLAPLICGIIEQIASLVRRRAQQQELSTAYKLRWDPVLVVVRGR